MNRPALSLVFSPSQSRPPKKDKEVALVSNLFSFPDSTENPKYTRIIQPDSRPLIFSYFLRQEELTPGQSGHHGGCQERGPRSQGHPGGAEMGAA